MTAGIPGTGIGGLFYLLMALCIPIRELYLTVRKRRTLAHWRLIKGHILITIWVMAGMWTTGKFVGMLLQNLNVVNQGGNNILRLTPFLLTLVTLSACYLGMHVLRLYVRTVEKPTSQATP